MTNQKMTMTNLFLVAFAGLCLAIALTIAWVLGVTLFFPDGVLAGHLVERADIIRAHIDYLMMSQFLFIFFLLFRQYAIDPPVWVVAACCFGAFFNPLSFLVRGLTPKPSVVATIPIEAHFPFQAGLSFTLTTVGFLTAVVLVVRAAWKLRSVKN
ncbi:hypothetical protein [Methylobacter tundripaludum]|uniref:Uncharacterized protein n=1 Tax=Methylobacter tundripaludum (strain ATCC BAA-1195 / DSM 17260 / SV96) TaxID=697282 RepID=G3IZ15_METTV|nr:hypothetical protein [Methylobacter tundripaludum]EGW20187.1 hypothetical protein Mettu_3317 [Methylobacter tundripaludum SV96]